jgi:hypothetical protein
VKAACLAASWLVLVGTLVLIGLSFSVDVHIAVRAALLLAGLPSFGCYAWASALKASPMQAIFQKKADQARADESSRTSPLRGARSSRRRIVTLAFAVAIGMSAETAMVGLAHGKSVEENGKFFRCSLKGCHNRVPITEADFWQLQAYAVRFFCSQFIILPGISIIAFTVQKEQRRGGLRFQELQT